jgi:hypothetical protein
LWHVPFDLLILVLFGESWGAKGLKTWQLRVKTPTRWCLFNVTLEILTWKPIKCQFRRKKWMRIIKEHIPMALLLCGEVTFASRLVGEARAPPCLRLSPAPQVPISPCPLSLQWSNVFASDLAVQVSHLLIFES